MTVAIKFEELYLGNPVPGYPSLLVVILFLGGIQLVALGIIGEYIGRMFNESKNRPLYFLKGVSPPMQEKWHQESLK